jgi:hypothetical protein
MRIFVMLVLAVVFASCVKNKNGQMTQVQQTESAAMFEAVEVIQGNSYTYIRAKESMSEKWMAVSKQDVQTGTVYYYDEALPMNNFHSKEIDRTFEEIFFVNSISTTPLAQPQMKPLEGHMGKVDNQQNSAITLEKQAGEITVAQIFANRSEYSAKEVEIRGVVVKINEQVMGKNWIHIQDGTSDNGNFDLTATSTDLPNLNDEVTIKGKIILNKDFGYGYTYEVIMEDAKVVSVKPGTSPL